LPVLIPSGHSRLLWGKRNPERLGRLLGEHHLLYRDFIERDVSRPLAAEYASEDLRCGLTGLIPADADGEERAPLYEPLFPRLRDLCACDVPLFRKRNLVTSGATGLVAPRPTGLRIPQWRC
jgi:hypothetical protein